MTIAAGPAVAEGTSAAFTVTLSEAAPADGLTLAYTVSEDGGFVAEPDEGAKTLDVSGGATSATISVPTAGDGTGGPDGTVTVTLGDGVGYVLGDPSSAAVTVRGGDATAPDTFTIYHDPDGGAAAVGRYETAVGLLDAAGRSYAVRDVEGTAEVERLAGVSGTVMPRFFLGDPEAAGWGPSEPGVNNGGLRWLRSQLEGQQPSQPRVLTASVEGGSAVDEGTPATFTVRLSEAAPTGGLTLAYRVSESGDFVAASDEGAKTLSIDGGARSAVLSVPTMGDDGDEPNGTVTVTLSEGDGYGLSGPSSAAVTVRDDDGAVEFTVYREAGHSGVARDRHDEAIALLDAAGRSYTVRVAQGSDVDRLAGTAGTVMPRFFLGDPAAPGWGPSQPGVNNGGLRWLRTQVVVHFPHVFVNDARVREAPGAVLVFLVTLDRTPTRTVTVDYETVGWTAQEGVDFTAVSGTLTFAPGETQKRVSVPVLDDAHDEGDETLRLLLTNASGLHIPRGDAQGTIENADPMPQAWTARFGRTVAVHVLDAVEARLEGSSESWAQLGGHRLGAAADVNDAVRRLSLDRDLLAGARAGARGEDMTARQLLLGSAFHLVSNGEDQATGPRLSAWGRVASSGFDGQAEGVSLDGTVTTATLGVDGTWQRWVSGLVVAYSEGDGSYGHAETSGGELSSSLASVHPYAAYKLSERVRLWGTVGYGSGALQEQLADRGRIDTVLSMTMGAAGVRGSLLQPSQTGGLELALRSDVLWMAMDSDAAENLAATEAEASRLRLVLEGSRSVALEGGGSFTPSLEVGVRHDGGDAETGSGVEAGGSLVYASAWGLSVEASVRVLLAHEAEDYTEWGASGALRFDPGRQGRGLTASIVPAWGAAAGGVQNLWGQPGGVGQPLADPLAAAAGRLDAELGYGLAALNGRGLLTPYARVALTEGADQAWHLGTRLKLAEILDLSLEAGRRAREGERAAHEVALLANLGW